MSKEIEAIKAIAATYDENARLQEKINAITLSLAVVGAVFGVASMLLHLGVIG